MVRPALADPSVPIDRPRRGRGDERERILDAAIGVFARDGYHGARVSDIARGANIAYGLVYHYFTNKEEILRSLFEERWSGFLEGVESIAEKPAPVREKLTALAVLTLSGYRLRPEWVKVRILDIQRSSRFAEPGQLRAVGRLFQIVARSLVEVCLGGMQKRGEVA
jgi:TetR/AcrR family fatty acid metabolism transcriptional regulator